MVETVCDWSTCSTPVTSDLVRAVVWWRAANRPNPTERNHMFVVKLSSRVCKHRNGEVKLIMSCVREAHLGIDEIAFIV